MICQNSVLLPADMQHYSCRFMDLARAREVLALRPWTAQELVAAWVGAREEGIISGDLNEDGDYDDPGEDEILDDQRLFEYLKVPLRAVPVETLGLPTMIDERGIPRVAPVPTPLDPARYWVLERWVWKIGHFIQGDGTGQAPAIYDSIRGGSMTRRNGRIESLRVFLIDL